MDICVTRTTYRCDMESVDLHTISVDKAIFFSFLFLRTWSEEF